MEKTLSVQEMYDKFHNAWPSYSTSSPIRAALCTIACDLGCILDGRATIAQCIAGLEVDRDESEEGVKYLYYPVIRDLRSLLEEQEAPEFDPNASLRGHIIEEINGLREHYPDVRFDGVKYGILHATGYADLCKKRDILDAAYLPSSRVIASIIDAALLDYAGPRICGYCGGGPSRGDLPVVDGKRQCYECAHPEDCDDEEVENEPDDCPYCKDSCRALSYTKKYGWLCAKCLAGFVSNKKEDPEKIQLTCEKCGGQFDSLLASPKGLLCEHCHYADEDEEQETTPADAHEHLDQLSNSRVERLVTDAFARLSEIAEYEAEFPETLKELQDNWALVQHLMPRYIQQFAAAVPAVPVTCQCVLCKE